MSEADKETAPILRAILALGRRLRSARPEGAATLSAISLLGALARLGSMPATQLAVEERLQPQSLTRLVASLEKAGLIERRRSETDRRELTIALTRKGKAALAEDLGARQAWLDRAMAEALTDAERSTLIAAANAMLKLAFHGGGKPE
jgi:DNA-binding MarR family transcriptional regulator